jgi:hypothetical protein
MAEPKPYTRLGRLGNAIYVTAIAVAIFCFILALMGMGSTVSTPLDMAIYVAPAALFSLALWGIGWVIRYVLGGGPAK